VVLSKNVVNRLENGANHAGRGVSFRETGITFEKLTH
jgi:hypothetical protein